MGVMMETIINWEVFTQFGLAGLILGVFFILLIYILKQHAKTMKAVVDRTSDVIDRMSIDHKESNEAWRKSFEVYSLQADTRQSETNIVLRDLTNVMTRHEANIQKELYQSGRRYKDV